MKHIAFGILAVVTLATSANGQSADTRSPQPNRLTRLVGRWTIEERYAGDSSKYLKTSTCELFGGAQHLVCQADAETPLGPTKSLSILSYDQSAGTFTQYTITNVGVAAHVTGTVTDTSWSGNTEFAFNGEKIKARLTVTDDSPTAWTSKMEAAFGGARTVVIQEARAVKAQ